MTELTWLNLTDLAELTDLAKLTHFTDWLITVEVVICKQEKKKEGKKERINRQERKQMKESIF